MPRLLVYSDAVGSGGAEQVLRTLLGGLSTEWEVVVIGVSEEVCAHVASARPDVPWLAVPSGPRWDLGSVIRLRRAIARSSPDVVHVNLTWPLASWHAQLALLTYRRPVVVLHEHLPTPFRRRVYRVVKRVLSRRADGHVVVSAAAADLLARETGLDREHLTVVPNGVDVPRASLTGRARKGPPVVVSVGRFTAQKGFDVLLQALRLVPDAVAHVVGARSPEDSDWLEGLADELGVGDRVRVLPWSDRIHDVLADADVVAVASRAEAAQLVLLEALAAGLPVVSTRVGSAEEVLGRLDERLLVPVEDPRALAGALCLVLSDRDLREDVGERGRHLVMTEYTTAAVCRRFEHFYRERLTARRGRGRRRTP
ncbi:glycosyltransferase family 4 protein [Geodermatophilus amargosae]|uniref:glycosyltransferase family 4 protein n=1 Tax=Geodermatophilus amargosae TaxID=1296565 RepID=UPI0034DDFB9E